MPTTLVGDLILQVENVVQRAVEPVGPEMRAGLRFDQLRGDAQAIARLAHAAFQHIAHAEFAPDLPDVDGPALVDEARIARDHEQPFDPRQAGDDVLDHAVGEIFLLRIAAHVLERQHRDRGLVGQREPRRGRFRLDGLGASGRLRLRGEPDLQRIDPHRLGDVLQLRLRRDR